MNKYNNYAREQTEAEQIEAWFSKLDNDGTVFLAGTHDPRTAFYCNTCYADLYKNDPLEIRLRHFRGDCLPKENMDAIPNGVYKESEFMEMLADQPTEPSLSLLVIDLGGCRVVVVDDGHLPTSLLPKMKVGASDFGPYLTFQGVDQIKAAIEGEKPVPRIESAGVKGCGRFLLKRDDNLGDTSIYQVDYDALSELAGKPLPIWTGGTWTQLAEEGDATQYPDDSLTMPVSIWRYTR